MASSCCRLSYTSATQRSSSTFAGEARARGRGEQRSSGQACSPAREQEERARPWEGVITFSTTQPNRARGVNTTNREQANTASRRRRCPARRARPRLFPASWGAQSAQASSDARAHRTVPPLARANSAALLTVRSWRQPAVRSERLLRRKSSLKALRQHIRRRRWECGTSRKYLA